MRSSLLIAALLLVAVPAAAESPASGGDSANKHFNIIIGQKMLDSSDWGKEFKAAGLPDLKNQTSFGLESTFGPKKWPVSLAFDVLYSRKQGRSPALARTVTGSTLEVDLGARKVFDIGAVPVHPYVGGGLAYGSGAVTCSGCSSRAPTGVGVWLNTGAFYRFSKFNGGLGMRYSSIDGKDGNIKLKVGGINVNAVLGMGF